MFWFITIPLVVLFCGSFLLMILTDKTRDGGGMPRIHYKRGFEGKTEYLLKICPASSKNPKDRLRILGELSCNKENYFLLEDYNGSFYLRKYETRSGGDGITRYILKDLNHGTVKKLKKQDSLDRLCRDSVGRSAAKMNINAWDNIDMKVLLNTYPIQEGFKDPIKAAFELEKKSVEAFIADNAKNTTGAREELHRQEASSRSATYLDDFEHDYDDPELDDFEHDYDDPELEDFDPDIDEAPEGYFINDFGEPEPITSDMEAEARWQECKRQIDYSLYVTHDWDIFKDEKDK